ncbi:MAG: alpha/beta hydrolase family protein [Planctomycetota bacterium]
MTLAVLHLGVAVASDMPEGAYKARPGDHEVAVHLDSWTDTSRRRDIPVKVYLPTAGKGPFPVIVFSHGLGGSRNGYEYLGRHWASHGYVSVHLQHPGSDESVWKDKPRKDILKLMRKAAANPINAVHRPRDVSFVIDRLEQLNRTEAPFKGRLDLDRLGVAGHSFGAYTTNAVAGTAVFTRRGRKITARDRRVKAVIPMSSPVPGDAKRHKEMFGAIDIPSLHMTGTKDTSIINDTPAEKRLIPYRFATHPETYLLVFEDGDHMVFSGRNQPGRDDSNDARYHGLILQSSTAFWDAYLREDPRARTWLRDGGFKKQLSDGGTFEHKPDKAD